MSSYAAQLHQHQTLLGGCVLAVLLLAAILEAFRARRGGLAVYRAAQTWSNVGCGLLRLTVGGALGGFAFAVYAAIFAMAAPLRLLWIPPVIPSAWQGGLLSLLLALLAYDFVFYWVHRLSHRARLLWAVHGVHHQSRDYNLSLSVRLGVFSSLFHLPFDLLLIVVGVDPMTYGAVKLLHASYMLCLHGHFGSDWGALGKLFNTPSFHRVHHSLAKEHHHCNMGGMLIIFDRIFGSFVAEPKALSYGVEDDAELNPVKANLVPLAVSLHRR